MKYVLNPKRKTSGNCNKGSYNLLKRAGVDEKYLKDIGDNKLSGIVWGWGIDMPWTKEEQKAAVEKAKKRARKNKRKSNNNLYIHNMVKVIIFYIICCTSNIIIDYILSTNIIEGKMFFSLLYLYTCIIYAPVCTLIVCVFKMTNINKRILNNYFYGFLYSIIPHVMAVGSDYICNKYKVEIKDLSFYVYIGTYVFINIVIIAYGTYNKYIKFNKL